MATPDLDTIFNWRGKTVRDPDGDKVGKLGDVYLDEATDQPAYAGVHTGLFGLKESVVPLDALAPDGDDLVIAYDAATVRDAPKVDPDDGLDADEEERLARHYRAAPHVGDEGRGDDGDDVADGDDQEQPSGLTDRTEGGMIRSEEEVSTSRGELEPAERVRIRKVLVTENVKKTVPVQREEIRLETEPAPEGDRVERVEE